MTDIFNKKKIALLTGGDSYEREISLRTAAQIEENINPSKFDYKKIEIPVGNLTDWLIELIQYKPDIALLALHGGKGEDGSVQGLLECLHVPYVGSKVLGSAICMDKYLSKQLMKAFHIPVADDVFIKYNENITDFSAAINKLNYPLIVKPNRGGSSIGIRKVHNEAELKKAVADVKTYHDDILIEKYISGNEVTCGVIETERGTEALQLLDIDNLGVIFDYGAKYETDKARIDISTLPKFLQTMIVEISKKAFKVLRCSGYCCIDMIISEEQIYVLEINTLPGMTNRSLLTKIVKGADISFSEYLEMLINTNSFGETI